MGEGKKKLPKGWAWASLGDTGEYFNGMAFKPTDWEVTGRPIIRIQNLNNPEKPINRTNKNVRERYLVKSGDLLVSWSATLDTFKWTGEEAVLNQHIFNVRPKAELDKQFIFHTLKYQIKVLINSEHMHGSTMRHINRKPFMSHRIPLPSLAEQKRIVDKVDELFSSIEAGERAIARARTALTRYRKAVLKAAVTGELTADWRAKNPPSETAQDLLARILKARYNAWEKAELKKLDVKGKARPEIDKEWAKFRTRYKEPVETDVEGVPSLPRGWVSCSMDSCHELLTSGSRGWAKFYSKEGATFVRAQNIKHEVLNLDDIAFVKLPSKSEGKRTALQKNDVLITITGANVTKTARVKADIGEAYVNQHVALLRPVFDDLSKYVCCYLQAPGGGNSGMMKVAYGAGKPGLSLGNIAVLSLPLPPLDEQDEIVSRVEEALSKADKAEATLSAQAKQAKALKQAVLKTAFEGRLVPQDPKDEPASELLKRIKAAS